MVAHVSGLSVALQAVATHLDNELGTQANVAVVHPMAANKQAIDTKKALVNIFAYRMAPSGFHADSGPGDPYWTRVQILITPFVPDDQTEERDQEIRLLGTVVQILQADPVLPVAASGPLPGPPGADAANDFRSDPHTIYRIQVVMQAPSMEELNYIWTTQGGETPLPYRLSAAYELSLIPIEPSTRRVVAGPVKAAILNVKPSRREKFERWQRYTDDTQGIALSAESGSRPPPVSWLPVLLFAADGSATTLSRSVPAATASVDLLAVGPVGEQVGIIVKWTRQDGTPVEQLPQFHRIDRARFDEATPFPIDLLDAGEGDEASIEARPAKNGSVIPDALPGNTLTLRVEAP